MKPTEILESEHRVIEQVLSCLEKLADQCGKGKKPDSGTAREMIEFFRMFADRFHHAKEEQHLFPALEAHGMPRDGGPVGVMLGEHETGRDFVGKMDRAVSSFEKGDLPALNDFSRAARAYVSLLREHIQKEDHCLFAMANESLSDTAQAALLKAFRAEEARNSGDVSPDFYRKKAEALAVHFKIKSPGTEGVAATSCGHHSSGACSGH